jgi:probable H4MPT-linked C1 transfer pathway protein
MSWLGIDIGGANLKIADGTGFAASRRFDLWRCPDQLGPQLLGLMSKAPPADHLAVTMTAELADCFATKAEGVRRILWSVDSARGGRVVWVYLLDGRFVPAEVAVTHPRLAAASNWHALARLAGRYVVSDPGLLLDVGSTTTDVIPLVDQLPAVDRPDDTSRLIAGQLLYTGVGRSPVCAVADSVDYRGTRCPLAQELFATMRDVYLWLGDVLEDDQDTDTADGRPATRLAARGRLARSICSDSDAFHDSDAVAAARSLAQAQLARIVASIEKVRRTMPATPATVVVCGQGEFLARRAVEHMRLTSRVVSLGEQLGTSVTACAPAHAVARLAREQLSGKDLR